LKILAPVIWPYSLSQFKYDRSIIAHFYDDPKNRPDTIYWLNTIPLTEWSDEPLDNNFPDPMKDQLNAYYDLKTKRKYYSIYERRK
jgi:hypothetical protein